MQISEWQLNNNERVAVVATLFTASPAYSGGIFEGELALANESRYNQERIY